MPPSTDSLDGRLTVDAVHGDSWTGQYTARLDWLGISINDYGHYDYRVDGRVWGDSFEVVIAPNAIDAQLPIRGSMRDSVASGSWERTIGATVSGTFEISPLGETRLSANRVLNVLVRTYPCRHDAIVITGEASLTREQRCALVEAGFWVIAFSRGMPGAANAPDTAGIRGAMIRLFAFRDTTGRPSTTYWTIDYAFSDPARTRAVQIDALTGAMGMALVEKP